MYSLYEDKLQWVQSLHNDYWELESKINKLCKQKANLYSQAEKRNISIKQIRTGKLV